MTSKHYTLVLDLETTGLSEKTASITEFAAVGVDDDFNSLFEFESLVKPDPEHWANLSDYLIEFNTPNGLYAEISEGLAADTLPSVTDVEDQILAFIDRHFEPGVPIYLGGSGVSHFDHRFLAEHMPRLYARLFKPERRHADVSPLREWYLRSTGVNLTDVNNDKTHRAMDDVRCHLEESRQFHRLFQTVAKNLTVGSAA